jgi:hypothetical protein
VINRLKGLGFILVAIGIVFVAAGAFAYLKVQDGQKSLNAFSAAQNVTLSYNEDGQLVDRGTVEGAQGILDLLQNDWGYTVVDSELNPNDPLVNTGSEYMYQMAMVAYHTLHSSVEVTLDEPVDYNGETFPAGTYTVEADGKYWADFDRMNPLEGPARAQIWSPTAHALIAELGVGSVTASTLQLGLGIVGLIAGLGVVFIVIGAGLFWVVAGDKKALKDAPAIETIDEPVNA